MIDFILSYLLVGSIMIPMLIVLAFASNGHVGLVYEKSAPWMIFMIIFMIVFWPVITWNALT